MKMIIDITKQEYNECKNLFNMVYQEGYLNYNLNTSLIMYIANGTPLEKIIERAIDELETEKKNYIKDVGKCGYTEGIGYAIQILKYLNKEEGKDK